MSTYIFYYLLAINLLTFLIFVWDKQRAIYNQRRVPEKILWLMALAGGSIGAIVAMELAKHKRRKASFILVLALIMLIQVALIYFYLKQFGQN
ncbi:DUF1294 domain-containing protein [Candidatus Kuenenbacteria bacterium]|nr:DUF1294 domain-containing protein [Candidatus Kuenenbacteria bacterium]